MAYNQFTCDATGAITGWSNNCDTDISATAKLFITDYDFQFDTEADAKSSTAWANAIIAKQIYPLPEVAETDDNSEDDVYWTSGVTSNQRKVRQGKSIQKHRIIFDPCLHKRLQYFNGRSVRIIQVDNNNNVIGTSSDGTIFQGLAVSTFNVDKWMASTGDTPAFTPIHIAYESTDEREKYIAVYKPEFNIKALNGVIPATLSVVGTPTSTELVVDVVGACDAVGVSGLLVANFIFLQADGTTEVTISTATESSTIPGRYTLAATAFTTLGTINLDGVVTVGNEYYQGTAVTVTIS